MRFGPEYFLYYFFLNMEYAVLRFSEKNLFAERGRKEGSSIYDISLPLKNFVLCSVCCVYPQ